MLIEVTEGARAAGSEPVYTDFVGRQLLVLENAVNINFSGFTTIKRRLRVNWESFLLLNIRSSLCHGPIIHVCTHYGFIVHIKLEENIMMK